MSFSTATFDREAAAVRAFAGRDLEALTGPEMANLRGAIGRAKRSFDAMVATVAGEAARRSAPDLGRGGMAKAEGHLSPEGMIADDLGMTPGEAGRIIKVGTAINQADQRARQDASGESAPEGMDLPQAPTRPHVTAAVKDGVLSIEQAAIITRSLDAIDAASSADGELGPDQANTKELVALERRLVKRAPGLKLSDLRRICKRQEALWAPQDLERKEQLLRNERYLAFSEDPTGMIVLHAKMDPASAAPIRTWIDAQVRAGMHRRREEPGEDARSAGQMRIDALTMLAQHGLDCEQPTSGVKTTVVVRVDKADLERGVGIGECDGLAGPISVSTLRRMAVDAAVLPVVMGGKSLPLDVGRAERYFTPAQRIALAERDGGCAWCHAPPSYCEAHHIDWWGRDKGTSNLRNGVLLCTSCHHNVHQSGWDIAVRGDQVWFTPPRSVDPERTPRIGGKAHLDLERV